MNKTNPRNAGRKALSANEKSVPINILFPPKLITAIRKKVEEMNYKNIAEYIRELVRKDLFDK